MKTNSDLDRVFAALDHYAQGSPQLLAALQRFETGQTVASDEDDCFLLPYANMPAPSVEPWA